MFLQPTGTVFLSQLSFFQGIIISRNGNKDEEVWFLDWKQHIFQSLYLLVTTCKIDLSMSILVSLVLFEKWLSNTKNLNSHSKHFLADLYTYLQMTAFHTPTFKWQLSYMTGCMYYFTWNMFSIWKCLSIIIWIPINLMILWMIVQKPGRVFLCTNCRNTFKLHFHLFSFFSYHCEVLV